MKSKQERLIDYLRQGLWNEVDFLINGETPSPEDDTSHEEVIEILSRLDLDVVVTEKALYKIVSVVDDINENPLALRNWVEVVAETCDAVVWVEYQVEEEGEEFTTNEFLVTILGEVPNPQELLNKVATEYLTFGPEDALVVVSSTVFHRNTI